MYQALREAWQELTAPGAPFAVERVDVRGESVLAYAAAPPSLRAVWLASAAHADKDYLVYRDERWTYAAAHREVASVASWLVAHDVGAGDRVAIAMRNHPEWLLAYWASLSVGASVVGMNAWWTGPEMAYAIEDSDPRVVICDTERIERLEPHAGEVGDRLLVGVRLEDAPTAAVVPWSELRDHEGAPPDVEIDPEDDACIFYTSGTTGRPKGARLTHRGCVNNLVGMAFWSTVQSVAYARAGREPGTAAPGGGAGQPASQVSALVATPLFHVTANNCIAHGLTAAGGKLVHLYKWDAGEALREIERERVTNFSGVPTMLRELIAHPAYPTTDTSSLTALAGGGAQVQPDLVTKVEKETTGSPGTGYGMTEACGIISANSGHFFIDKPDSAGPAMPVFETKCIDADGKALPAAGPGEAGEIGELCVRGAQVFRGYLNRPEATAESLEDGWLRTGDIARIDGDGFIYIVDRAKDMVLRGGENVYCAEVESVIFEHPAVAECAVFAVPDDRLGEEVGVAIVLRTGASMSADELRSFCAERAAKYKIPRYIWLMSEALPRGATGKFLKRELRERLDVAEAR